MTLYSAVTQFAKAVVRVDEDWADLDSPHFFCSGGAFGEVLLDFIGTADRILLECVYLPYDGRESI